MPPDGTTLIEPLHNVPQVAALVDGLIVSVGGETKTTCCVSKHPLKSETKTLYVPAHNAVADCVF